MPHPVKLIKISPNGTRVPYSLQVKSDFHLYAKMLQLAHIVGTTVVLYSFKGFNPSCYSLTRSLPDEILINSAEANARSLIIGELS